MLTSLIQTILSNTRAQSIETTSVLAHWMWEHHLQFVAQKAEEIIVQLLGTHSGYAENPPQTLDAKVLSTADALGHLSTNFYNVINREGMKKLFDRDMTEEEYKAWFLEKIDRDFYNKIFFENIREEVRPRYEQLKKRYTTY